MVVRSSKQTTIGHVLRYRGVTTFPEVHLTRGGQDVNVFKPRTYLEKNTTVHKMKNVNQKVKNVNHASKLPV